MVDCVNSDMIHKEPRWNSIRLNWLRQQVLDQLVRMVWVSGDDMLADICTKHLSSHKKFMETRALLMNLKYRFTKFYGRR